MVVPYRTPGTGIYDNLQQYNLSSATDIFDITFFPHNPFTLSKELHPGKYQPNPVHWFIRLLQEKGVLLRNYTQNIDGLERCYVYVRKDNVCTVYSLYCKFKNFSSDIIFAVAWFSMKFSSLKINISLILS